MTLDEVTLARFERLLLDDDTVERYRAALKYAPEGPVDAFCAWVVSEAQGMPAGTLLPLRAAANHVLLARFGLSESEAQARLPPAKGRHGDGRDYLTAEQLAVYYDAVEHMDMGSVRTVLLLLPRTALRISEIVALTWDDRQPYQGADCLRIEGKGNKVRFVRLSRASARILDDWHDWTAKQRSGVWMFPGYRGTRLVGRPITQAAVQLACRRLRTDNPELGNLTPHVLRHTWATTAVGAGVDLKRVQAVLGHARLETTSVYLHASGDSLREAMDAADPDEGEE